MKNIEILSFNVNGLRSAVKHGFMDWLKKRKPDILCFQEVKAQPEDLPDEIREPEGYHAYWTKPKKKGYSGVAILSKEKPTNVEVGMGVKKFDDEGRVIVAEYSKFIVVNVYIPHGRRDLSRLPFKMEFHEKILKFFNKLKKKNKKLFICGDFNVAHNEIDIARPKANMKNTGFLPEERAWMDEIIGSGYVDTFRYFHPETVKYTFWDTKSKARERDVGWRIDYFIVPKTQIKSIKKAFVLTDVMGSDHCPIGIKVEI